MLKSPKRACLYRGLWPLCSFRVSICSSLSFFGGPEVLIARIILFAGGVIGFFWDHCPLAISGESVSPTVYAITDRRTLMHQGVGWSVLWLVALPDLYDPLCSFDARQIRARRRIQRYQGRVDLVLGGEGHNYFTGKGQIRELGSGWILGTQGRQ